MKKLIYFLVKNKRIIIIISIILICAIAISIGVYAQITNRNVISSNKQEDTNNYEDLESNFDDIFTNTINEESSAKSGINYNDIVYCAYNIEENKSNYDINAKIPLFKLENDVTKEINNEIYNTFAKTIMNIVKSSNSHTIFNLDYVVYVNNNILSLVLRCKYKDGSNPQRNIIQTFNYNLDDNKLVDINEMLSYKNLNKEDLQEKVLEKIKQQNTQMKTISDQGYNVYMRNEDDDMYKIENTPNFFLGQNNALYLVYAYGNNNFTSEMDLVIF